MIDSPPRPPEVSIDAAERTLALLGLARRAGLLILGSTAVERLVHKGVRPLVVLASDAGSNQKRRVLRWQPVQGLVTGLVSRRDLSQRLGRGNLAVVAVVDRGFMRGLIDLGVVTSCESMTAESHRNEDGRRR